MGILDKLLKQAKAGTSPVYSYGEFIVLDVETTGLDPNIHKIIELALVRVNNGIITESYEQRFNPEGPVGKTEIHGITAQDLENAPLFSEKTEEIKSFIGEKVLVAHNARFDLAFLRTEFSRANAQLPWLASICTLEASKYYLPDLSRRRLADCCDRIGIRIDNAHSALGDAIATAKLCHFYLMPEKQPTPRASDLSAISNPILNSSPAEPKRSAHVSQRIANESTVRTRVSESALSQFQALGKAIGSQNLIKLSKEHGEAEYFEKLMEFFEDGTLTSEEFDALKVVAEVAGLSAESTNRIHEELITGVIEIALGDEKISSNEKEEFKEVSILLGVKQERILPLTKVAKARRIEKLSRNLKSLPETWNLGEPLRVGDSVVFTGCEPSFRENLEQQSKRAGVTISSSVTKKTKMLVTDDSWVGNKANDAKALGIRFVKPGDYSILLDYIQPPL